MNTTTPRISLSKSIPHDLRQHRMHIRNAYLAESVETIQTAIDYSITKRDWFRVSCLIELTLED